MPDNNIMEAQEYIDAMIPNGLNPVSTFYYKKINTIIVAYYGAWSIDAQNTLRQEVLDQFRVDMDFQSMGDIL